VPTRTADHDRFVITGAHLLTQQEVGPDVRVSTIPPGVTTTELADTITDPDAKAAMASYRATAIPADAIARAIAFSIAQPDDVDVNEIVIRPTGQA